MSTNFVATGDKMALDMDGSRFLLYAKSRGVDFTRTAMIGRQRLCIDSRRLSEGLIDVVARNSAEFGYRSVDIGRLLEGADGYAEPFLKLLGCKQACSFDASPYEQATYVHDFNFPIDQQFHGGFTAVIDGGTLEHIFNFPVAIKNCMEMLEVGGHYLGITPTNNASGHGFYQFSPELYFRIFSAENGFRTDQVIAYETNRKGANPWFLAVDPLQLRESVGWANRRQTYLLVIAERIEKKPIFTKPVQQSCYTERVWNNDTGALDTSDAGALRRSRLRHFLQQHLPERVKKPIRSVRRMCLELIYNFNSPYDARLFRKLTPPQ
jgi:hypothetical protein